MIKKHKKFLLIAIGVLLVGTLSLTYAYFAGGAGPGANTDVNVTASRTEKLIFDEGDPINLLLNEVTLAEGGGNVTGSSTATATLIASETTNNSAANYNVYLNINANNFTYTTPEKTPEIIVEITDPTGVKVTSITGLSYVTVSDNQGNTTTGFDITSIIGRFDIRLDEAIASTDSVTGTTEDWTIKVSYINLATNQAANAGKSMDINFILDQRENVTLNEIVPPTTFSTAVASVTGTGSPVIDEMKFSNVKSADYETASLKWDVSANTGSEEVVAYIEDHATDGRILHVQANGDVVFYGDAGASNKTYFKNVDTINLSDNINTTYVDDMSYMFHNSTASSIDLSGVDTTNAKNMSYMFYGVDATTIDMSSFDTSNVSNMSSMFEQSELSTIDISGFDTSNVTNMKSMFDNVAATTINRSNLDTSEVTDMSYMFEGSNIDSFDFSSLDTSKVTNMQGMFYQSTGTNILNLGNLDTSKVTNMSYMFYGTNLAKFDLSKLDTSSATNMKNMFESSTSAIDLSNFDTSNVTDMQSMFKDSSSTVIDVSGFDTSKVTDMSYMFQNSRSSVIDVSGFNTSKVTDMRFMFFNTVATVLDVKGFNTGRATDMSYMFYSVDASALNVSGFDTSNVTNMSGMFSRVDIRELDVSRFNTSGVEDMENMFSYAKIDFLDLSNFDSSSLSEMEVHSFGNSYTDIHIEYSIKELFYYSSINKINISDSLDSVLLSSFNTIDEYGLQVNDQESYDDHNTIKNHVTNALYIPFGSIIYFENSSVSNELKKYITSSNITITNDYNEFLNG